MHKPRITLVVDIVGFFLLAALAGLGLVLQFVLTPATGLHGPMSLTWLGLDRHLWELAYFSGLLVVLALAAVHLILHWAWYVKLYEEAVPNATVRAILAPLGAVAALLLLFLPLLAKPQLREVNVVAAPPATLPPGQVAETKVAGPAGVQLPPPDTGTKTSALTKARPQKISRRPRPVSYRLKYRYPAHYGKWHQKKPVYRYCLPYRRYVLAGRSR